MSMHGHLDVAFCASEFKSEWRQLGLYYPIGPVILISGNIPEHEEPSHPLFHELLHVCHFAGSSIGLLDIIWRETALDVHLNFRREGRILRLDQPYIKNIVSSQNDALTQSTLESIINLFYFRRLFAGYRVRERLLEFPRNVDHAIWGFNAMGSFVVSHGRAAV